MACINRIFLMKRDQTSCIVINLLGNTNRRFICVHYFDITRIASYFSRLNFIITPPPSGSSSQFGKRRSFCFRVAIYSTSNSHAAIVSWRSASAWVYCSPSSRTRAAFPSALAVLIASCSDSIFDSSASICAST